MTRRRPEGFKDLRHAFTLFADSAKRANAQQRGRFNLGEKLVLAISDEVTVRTASGGIRFDDLGRHTLRNGQPKGSRVECVLKMSADQCEEIAAQVQTLIAPDGIVTMFNGTPLKARIPLQQFPVTLPTEMAAADGLLRRVNRETTLRLFPVKPGETAMLYEMGIPVVETGDKWHCDIGQKVPLTLDRENVPPAFLRQVRVVVLNRMHAQLGPEDVNSPWAETAVLGLIFLRFAEVRFAAQRAKLDKASASARRGSRVNEPAAVHGVGGFAFAALVAAGENDFHRQRLGRPNYR